MHHESHPVLAISVHHEHMPVKVQKRFKARVST